MQTSWVTKGLACGIILLFVGTSMMPLANSASTQQSFSTDSSKGTSIKNNYFERQGELKIPINGLAPQTKRSSAQTIARDAQPALHEIVPPFFAYNAFDPNGMANGPVTFNLDAVVNLIQGTGINFISGSDFDRIDNWYMVGFYGGLYQCDLNTGNMTFIANTIPCDSLAYDSITRMWYVASDNSLYTIDIKTGETMLVGFFGIATYMISVMIDRSGTMYGYDAVDSGYSSLYTINKTTSVATIVGSMNHTFYYAQEGKFDRDDNTLYLAAYDIGMGESYLATCDPATAAVIIINQFSPLGIEIDGLAIPWAMDYDPRPSFTWTPSNPLPGETILFNASASFDPSGNITLYEWDWNNDGIYEENHTTPLATHSWTNPGNYGVWLKVTDDLGLTGRAFRVVTVVNQAPETPTINGSHYGKINVDYSFSIGAITDPAGDQIYCEWDWGDGNTSGWLGPYNSGETVSASHAWSEPGTYAIKVKLKDSYGVESEWSAPFTIVIVQLKKAFFLGTFESLNQTDDLVILGARFFMVIPSQQIFYHGWTIVLSKDAHDYLGTTWIVGVGGIAIP